MAGTALELRAQFGATDATDGSGIFGWRNTCDGVIRVMAVVLLFVLLRELEQREAIRVPGITRARAKLDCPRRRDLLVCTSYNNEEVQHDRADRRGDVVQRWRR